MIVRAPAKRLTSLTYYYGIRYTVVNNRSTALVFATPNALETNTIVALVRSSLSLLYYYAFLLILRGHLDSKSLANSINSVHIIR